MDGDEYMEVIIVSKKKLNRIFDRCFSEFELVTDFMHGDEQYSEFVKTKRYRMMTKFQNTLHQLKQKIIESEFTE